MGNVFLTTSKEFFMSPEVFEFVLFVFGLVFCRDLFNAM